MNNLILPQVVSATQKMLSVAPPSDVISDTPTETLIDSGAPVVQVQKPPVINYVEPPEQPNQKEIDGIRFDFNFGCRIALDPDPSGQTWSVKFKDLETGNLIVDSQIAQGVIHSTKKYYIPFRIEVSLGEKLVFSHDLNLKGKEVLVQMPVGTLGDTLGWFPYVHEFQKKHGCKLTCSMSEVAIDLVKDTYPHLNLVPMNNVDTSQFYASYRLGLFFDDWDCTHQPVDFRYVGLHKTAAYILGVEPVDIPAQLALGKNPRTIKEPYVCIAVQSSTLCKYWNHPGGWIEIVKWLKSLGYRVLCIDKEHTHGVGYVTNSIPNGAEDFTGNRPLKERAQLLAHAEFFVGVSSGLAWLAYASGTPVVMISGFTHPLNEFYTPYRVINYHTCNSCWNDPRHTFDHFDFFWCPRHKGTDRQFECSRLITIDHVKRVIEKVPSAAKRLLVDTVNVVKPSIKR
jgi:autotransporter strand-loop-strand O-heptosyltransferase